MPSVVKTIVRGLVPILFLTTGIGAGAQQFAGSPVNPAIAPGDQDPNLPFPRGISKAIAQGGSGVSWGYGTFLGGMFVYSRFVTSHASAPYVAISQEKSFGRAPQDCEYLGFVDGVGSLLFNTQDGAVYSFNGGTDSLVKRYATVDEIPVEVMASIHNKRYLYISKKDLSSPLPGGGTPDAGTHYATRAQETDPNFPPGMGDLFKPGGLPLSWVLNATQPSVTIGTRDVPPPGQTLIASIPGLYLGFNQRGSWVASTSDGTVYVWNLASRTLTPGAKSWWEVPRDLANPSPLMQAIIFYDSHSYAASKATGTAEDPNFPPSLAYMRNGIVPVIWDGGTEHDRGVSFANSGLGIAGYLGFNERGSWLESQNVRRVFIWNFKTLSLTDVALRVEDVPASVLATLRNRSRLTQDAITLQTVRTTTAVTSMPATRPPLDENAAQRSAMYNSGTASAAVSVAPQIKGTAVSVTGGVLTFTINDPTAQNNGKQMSYKVTRSGNPALTLGSPGAPTSAGIAGSWIADDPSNKDAIILFMVKDEHTVVGTVMSGMVAAAMKRMTAAGAH